MNSKQPLWQPMAHLAHNRDLRAGTILGSGTVSNRNVDEVGSACLAERRALEVIDQGVATTRSLDFGDRLRFEVVDAEGRSVFGAIDHRMVPALGEFRDPRDSGYSFQES